MDKKRSIKFSIIFLSACAFTMGPVSLLVGQYLMGILLIVMMICVDLAYFFMKDSDHDHEFSYFVIVSAVTIIFATHLASGNILFSIPMMIVAASLSALFFDTKLIITGFGTAAGLFALEYFILNALHQEAVLSFIKLIESEAAILSCGFLIYSVAKSGLEYLDKANDKQNETTQVLNNLDLKNRQTEKILNEQKDLLQQIECVADQVTSASESLADQSQNLTDGSTRQAGSIEKLTENIEHVSGKVKDTDFQAQKVRDALERISEEIVEGNSSMDTMIAAVEDIRTSMKDIEKIIKSINDIAFQTNILALNASVEAARAGTAGKGFTVVADEVRNLAQHSANAVKETIQVLSNCQEAVNRGHRIAGSTADILANIKTHSSEVTSYAFQISDMTTVQMHALQEVAEEIRSVSSEVQTTAEVAEESATAAKELTEQAYTLHTLSASKQ